MALLFLRFDETRIGAVKEWLGRLWPRLATLNAVAQFNDAYRTMRRLFKARVDARTLPPDPELYAIWVNIAFTANGIGKLAGPGALAGFETAFVEGAEVRAGVIGDAEDGSPGSPQT